MKSLISLTLTIFGLIGILYAFIFFPAQAFEAGYDSTYTAVITITIFIVSYFIISLGYEMMREE